MQKLMSFVVLVFLSTTYFSITDANAQKIAVTPSIEVMYFHGTNRCITCNAVESHAKTLLEEKYKNEIKNGTIKFVSYNIDEATSKTLVEKYEIAFSTLLIVRKLDKKESKTDFTNTAFQYAKNNPTKYKELLKAEVDKNLK